MVEGGRCKALRDDCTITVKRLYQKPMKKELSRRFGGAQKKKARRKRSQEENKNSRRSVGRQGEASLSSTKLPKIGIVMARVLEM